MKIHNIASIGIFAAIFGGMASAHATTIASKEYVDARVDLKQNRLAVGTNVTVDSTSNTTAADSAITNVTTDSNGNVTFVSRPISVSAPAATTYVTDGDNALAISTTGTNGETHAPSIDAVKGMKQDKQVLNTGETIANVTQYTSTTTNGDKKVPTVQAVGQQFEKFANTHNNVLTSGITSTKVGNYDTAATAVTNAISSNIITAANNYLLKRDAFNNTIAYHKKADNTHTASLAIENVGSDANIFRDNTVITGKLDDYVPTVAAVEARVQAVHDEIPTIAEGSANGTISVNNSNISVHGLGTAAYIAKGANTANSNANSLVTVNSNGFVTGTATAGALAKKDTIANTDVASDAAIALSKLGTLASYSKPNSAGTVATGDSVQTAIGKLDKAIDGKAAKASGLTAATTKYNTVKYNADGIVIAGNDLTALADVNSTSTASCDETNPCVLTYYKKNGATFMRWTSMLTESTSANTSATTSGDTAASS